MTDIEEITKVLQKFNEDRDWNKFHNPKDLALAINIEAGELLELFLWKKAEDADIEKVKKELADVLAFSFLLANKLGFRYRLTLYSKRISPLAQASRLCQI